MLPYLLLAMQGGGAYGSYQAGMLFEYFKQGGQPYDGGYGVSVGGLNVAQLFGTPESTLEASKLAQPGNAKELTRLWETEIASNESVFKAHKATRVAARTARALLGRGLAGDLAVAALQEKNSVHDTEPLRALLSRYLGHKRWPEHVYVGAVHTQTGEFIEIPLHAPTHSLSAVEAVLASAAIPIVFPAVGDFVDGGVTDVTPLRQVFRRFNDHRRERADRGLSPQPLELHILRASAFPQPEAGPFDRLDKVLMRTLTLFVNNTDREDYERAIMINDVMGRLALPPVATSPEVTEAFAVYRERYALIDAYIIGPSKNEMGQFSDSARHFSRSAVKKGIELGRRRMHDFLHHKDDYLLEVVHMNDDVPKLPR